MRPRIVLILPSVRDQKSFPRRRVPSGLLSIAAAIVQTAAVKVEILDVETLGWSVEETVQFLSNRNPNVIGISVCSPAYFVTQGLMKAIRAAMSSSIIVLGGKHISHCWQDVLAENAEVDAVVVGEGEVALSTIGQLATNEGYLNREIIASTVGHLPNVIVNGFPKPVAFPPTYDLASAPPRPFECLIPTIDFYLGDKMLIEYSRGCRGACTYCLASKYLRSISFRNTSGVVKELEHLSSLGFKDFFFTDDDFASSPEMVAALCRGIIEANLEIEFDANVRPDSLIKCDHVAKLMFNAGCRALWIGIETGNRSIAKSYRKGFNLDCCKDALAVAFRASRIARTNWIFGSPLESEESINDSTRLANELRSVGPHLPHASFLIPYKGTEVYRQALELGLIDTKRINAGVWLTHDRPVMPSIHLSRESLHELYVRFHRDLYPQSFLTSLDERTLDEAMLILRSARIDG